MKEWRIARWPLRKSLLALILPAVLLCMLAFGLFLDLCQYFGQKKLKYYADFFSSSSSLCCGVI